MIWYLVKRRNVKNGLQNAANDTFDGSTSLKTCELTSLRRSSRIKNRKSRSNGCQEFSSCSNKPTGYRNESCETLFLIPTDHSILIRALNKNPKVLEMIKIGRGVQIWVHPTYHIVHVLGEQYVRAKEDILDVIKTLKSTIKTNFQTYQLF